MVLYFTRFASSTRSEDNIQKSRTKNQKETDFCPTLISPIIPSFLYSTKPDFAYHWCLFSLGMNLFPNYFLYERTYLTLDPHTQAITTFIIRYFYILLTPYFLHVSQSSISSKKKQILLFFDKLSQISLTCLSSSIGDTICTPLLNKFRYS